MSQLTLKQASTIVDAALAEGRKRDFKPLCVTVLDAGGHVMALKREDGASILRPQVAHGKAAGALGMGMGSRALAQQAQERPVFFNALNGLAEGAMVPVPGGVLIRNANGDILGAAGASGDVSDNDEACLVAAISAAGLMADTGG